MSEGLNASPRDPESPACHLPVDALRSIGHVIELLQPVADALTEAIAPSGEMERFQHEMADPHSNPGQRRELALALLGAIVRLLREAGRRHEFELGPDARLSEQDIELFRWLYPISSPLFERFQTDHPQDKLLIARSITRRYFQHGEVRCFIQASSQALHLGEVLGGVAENCLFHTNSVLFPLLILSRGRGNVVYPLAGHGFNRDCGGWDLNGNDHDGETYLRDLFRRGHDRLDRAFLSPMAVTMEGLIYYRTEAAARLARIVADQCPQSVFMVVADRLYPSASDLSRTESWCPLERSNENSQHEIVIAGLNSRIDRSRAVERLGQRFASIVWMNGDPQT